MSEGNLKFIIAIILISKANRTVNCEVKKFVKCTYFRGKITKQENKSFIDFMHRNTIH